MASVGCCRILRLLVGYGLIKILCRILHSLATYDLSQIRRLKLRSNYTEIVEWLFFVLQSQRPLSNFYAGTYS
jgi:hypothetical protein